MWGSIFRIIRQFCCVFILVTVTGCATTGSGDPRDPLEGFNRGVYTFNEGMDNVIFDPLSKLYQAITPDFVDKGITNFFTNLEGIAAIANDILQFKINRALSDITRLFLNTTVGFLGFNDIASDIGLPAHSEDFGQTLAQWGIGSGPYLMVPFFGPTTLRDATGFVVDKGFLNPVFYIDNDAVKAGLLSLNYVDFKADLISAKKLVGEAALDEYEFIKSAYFEKRASQISE